MATEVISTIGTDGDYSTLHAWYAARCGDLVSRDTIEIAELKGESHYFDTQLWMHGDTVDSGHYFVIRPVTGAYFRGDFGNLDGQAVIRPGASWSSGNHVIICQDYYTRFIGFAVVGFDSELIFDIGGYNYIFYGIGISDIYSIYNACGICLHDPYDIVIQNCVFADIQSIGITTYCIEMCQTSCQSVCASSCQDACEYSCQVGCEVSCECWNQDPCQSSCQEMCQSSCQEMCQSYCQDACEYSYQGSSESSSWSSSEWSSESSSESSSWSSSEWSSESSSESSSWSSSEWSS